MNKHVLLSLCVMLSSVVAYVTGGTFGILLGFVVGTITVYQVATHFGLPPELKTDVENMLEERLSEDYKKHLILMQGTILFLAFATGLGLNIFYQPDPMAPVYGLNVIYLVLFLGVKYVSKNF